MISETMSLRIRPVLPSEDKLISELALRSKAYWGYSSEFINSCLDELTYSSEQITSSKWVFQLCEDSEMIVGFYSINFRNDKECELDALFVEPGYIGKGYGKSLMEHAKGIAKQKGMKNIIIQGDPNADKFYQTAGGLRIGERESGSIPGRFLPLYKIELK